MKDIKLTERREEFYQRAISAPYNRNEDGLFILTVWIYATDAEIDMERCGSYSVVKAGETRFRSKAEAEEALRNYGMNGKRVYRFIVSEIPEDSPSDGGIRYEWIYDACGKLIDNSYASMHHYDREKFYGRPKDKIRFKPGDLVEWFDGCDSVTLGVVAGLPPSIDQCWERMRCVLTDRRFEKLSDKEDGYILDFTDDSYVVIDTPDYMVSHEHVASHYVAFPSIPVSEKLRGMYAKVYMDYLAT